MRAESKKRIRAAGRVIFVLYIAGMIYFLFFAESLGRNIVTSEYSYNLTPFKEITRFIRYADILGWQAVLLNLLGNVLAFLPLGAVLPVIKPGFKAGTVFAVCTGASLAVELLQLATKRGSFDIDDIILNVAGGMAGYLCFRAAKAVFARHSK